MNKKRTKEFMRYRWIVFGVLIFAYMIVFFHRLAAGVVREELVKEFNMSGVTFANLSSTYFYAYMIMQIPAGILADTLGARKTVTAGTLLAGIGSIIFGFANTLFLIFLGRLFVGLGVSVVFIAILKIQSQWFKESEFGTLSGMTSFFGNLGGTFAQTPLVLLVATITWRYSFIAIGIFTIMVSALCYVLIRNKPTDMGFPSIEEIDGKEKPNTINGKIDLLKSIKSVTTNIRTWAPVLVFTGFFSTYATLTGTWGVSYLMDVYGISKVASTNYITVAVVGHAIGAIIIGIFSDKVKKRKLPMAIFGALYLLGWSCIVFWNGGKPPIEFLMVLLFIIGFTCSSYILTWACSKEINPPEIAGISSSIVNTVGFFGAAVLPPMIGRVIDKFGSSSTPTEMYQKAFVYCFIPVLISFISIFFIKETNCKNIYSKVIDLN